MVPLFSSGDIHLGGPKAPKGAKLRLYTTHSKLGATSKEKLAMDDIENLEPAPGVATILWASSWLISIVLFFFSYSVDCAQYFRGECMEATGFYIRFPWMYLIAKILFGIGALAIIPVTIRAVKDEYFSKDSS